MLIPRHALFHNESECIVKRSAGHACSPALLVMCLFVGQKHDKSCCTCRSPSMQRLSTSSWAMGPQGVARCWRLTAPRQSCKCLRAHLASTTRAHIWNLLERSDTHSRTSSNVSNHTSQCAAKFAMLYKGLHCAGDVHKQSSKQCNCRRCCLQALTMVTEYTLHGSTYVAGCLTCNLIGASQAGAFVSLVVSILRLL